jgi:hypothetical protein
MSGGRRTAGTAVFTTTRKGNQGAAETVAPPPPGAVRAGDTAPAAAGSPRGDADRPSTFFLPARAKSLFSC